MEDKTLMSKYILILFTLFFICCKLTAQTDTIIINGQKFITVKQTEKNEYERTDTILKFYRILNGKVKYLLKHYLYTYGTDCNNEFTDIGSYKIQNDSLIFITDFLQKTGIDPIPVKQKQIYKVDASGKMHKIFDMVQQRSGEWTDSMN
jgi:hypothetical protein